MKRIAAVVMAALVWTASASAQEGDERLMTDVDREAEQQAAPAQADEMRALEGDMQRGHEAAVEAAPATAPADTPAVTTTSTSENRKGAMRRDGFTFEVGVGVNYTSEYVDSDERVAGALAGSVGYFLNNNTALLLRMAASNASQSEDETVFAGGRDRDADRYYSITTLFVGPQIQWFPHDRVMLALGAGFASRIDTVRLAVKGTDDGDFDDSKAFGGVGASARAAFTVYQRQDVAALRIGIEALPSYIHDDWKMAAGLVGELQVF